MILLLVFVSVRLFSLFSVTSLPPDPTLLVRWPDFGGRRKWGFGGKKSLLSSVKRRKEKTELSGRASARSLIRLTEERSLRLQSFARNADL